MNREASPGVDPEETETARRRVAMSNFRSPRSPLVAELPEAWIIDQQPQASIEPPRPWAELPLPMWDEREAPSEEETAPTGGTVVIFDI